MVKFRVNSEEFDNAVKDALKEVKSLKPVFLGIAREFYKTNRAIFTLQSAGKYPDFKGKRGKDGYTNYQRWKVSKIGKGKFNVGANGYPLLKLTGRLEESITVRGSADAFENIQKTFMEIGTKVPYGVYHQQPDTRGRVIPYRPFLFLDPATTAVAPDGSLSRRSEAWTRAIEKYVTRKLKSIGVVKGDSTNG
jgi:phage gpG-like protein